MFEWLESIVHATALALRRLQAWHTEAILVAFSEKRLAPVRVPARAPRDRRTSSTPLGVLVSTRDWR
jgi:hypothetical protein